jgi:hypothetical protein
VNRREFFCTALITGAQDHFRAFFKLIDEIFGQLPRAQNENGGLFNLPRKMTACEVSVGLLPNADQVFRADVFGVFKKFFKRGRRKEE